MLSRGCGVDVVTSYIELCDGFLSLEAGVKPEINLLEQHTAQVLVRPNALETLPHFFRCADISV